MMIPRQAAAARSKPTITYFSEPEFLFTIFLFTTRKATTSLLLSVQKNHN